MLLIPTRTRSTILVALVALGTTPIAVAADEVAPPSAASALHDLVEEFYERSLELQPVLATFNGDHRFDDRFPNTLSAEYRAEAEAVEREGLARIEAIDRSQLDGQDLVTWEVFHRDRLEALEGLRFPEHLLPVNQLFSMPVLFVQLGSPGGVTPFETAEDYDEWLRRVDGFATWMRQAIVNLREGVERGIVLPTVIVDKTLPMLAGQVVDDPTASGFFAVIEQMPESIAAADRARLERAYRTAIAEVIVPAYAALHDYLRDEYRPHSRASIGVSALPDGRAWYEFAIRQNTNTELSAQEIHEIGLAEVDRIEGEMRALASEVGFEGDLGQLFAWVRSQPQLRYASEEAMLDGYRELRARVEPRLPELFARLPRADFEIRPVEAYRQATTPGAHYQPAAPDGSRLGVFYVNTGGWQQRSSAGSEALFLHEAIPGHHFQVSIARELGELPRFRRFGLYTAYVEGWALYVERLGEQLGLYRDPFQRLGQLQSELFRARRLVVDTGIHALGWTREQALAYLPSEIEVDRYIVMPGQALAYKTGELKLRELRARAERRLGDRFDLRAFHDAVLADGAVPLDVLERRIEEWIVARENEAAPTEGRR